MEVVQPPRPTRAEVEVELAEHVRALAGPDAVPRPDQIAAVTAVVADAQRTLLVARTGFGKSAVYFSATRMLRDRGWGPTVVVSPLLALMRDQVGAAERLGLSAVTINSSNIDAWSEMEERIARDEVDLLLIAPERLAENFAFATNSLIGLVPLIGPKKLPAPPLFRSLELAYGHDITDALAQR